MKKTVLTFTLVLALSLIFTLSVPTMAEEKAPLTPTILIEKWLTSTEGTVTLPKDLADKALPVDTLMRLTFTHIIDHYPDLTLEDLDEILIPDISLETEDSKTIFRFSSFLVAGSFHFVLDAATGELTFFDIDTGAGGNG